MADQERKYCVMFGRHEYVIEKWPVRHYYSPDDIPKDKLLTWEEAWDIVNTQDYGEIWEVDN